jgi:hypothetical protein
MKYNENIKKKYNEIKKMVEKIKCFFEDEPQIFF